jgi:O-antigen/teichoic acid export membrane protein
MMKELLEQNIYALITPLTVLISGVVVSLLFTRLLNQTDFGVFSTLIAFTLLFAGISDLGTVNALITIAGKSFHSKDGHAGFYVRYLLTWKLAALVIVSLLLILFPAQLSQFFFHTEAYTYVMQTLSALTILYSISIFISNLFIATGRFEYSSLINIAFNGLKVLSPLILVLFFGSSLETIIIGVLLAFLLSALYSLWLFSSKFKQNLAYKPTKSSAVSSFFFFSTVLSLASLLSSNIDSIMLNYFRGPADLALFTVSSSVVFLLVSLLPLSSTFLLSTLVQMEAKKEADLQKRVFDRSIKYGLLAAIPLSFLVYLTANRIILFLWPLNYLPAAQALRVLSPIVPLMFLSGICLNVFMSKRKMKDLTLAIFLAYVLTWLSGLYLISQYGLSGTAITFVLSQVFQLALLIQPSLKMLKLKFNPMHILKPTLASLIIALVVILLNPLVNSTIMLFLIAGVLFCLVYFPLLDDDDKRLANALLSYVKIGPLFS